MITTLTILILVAIPVILITAIAYSINWIKKAMDQKKPEPSNYNGEDL